MRAAALAAALTLASCAAQHDDQLDAGAVVDAHQVDAAELLDADAHQVDAAELLDAGAGVDAGMACSGTNPCPWGFVCVARADDAGQVLTAFCEASP